MAGAGVFPSPTPKQLKIFIEKYFSKEIDEEQVNKFMNYFKNGSAIEKQMLETCVSLLTPFSIRSLFSVSTTYHKQKQLVESNTQTTEKKKCDKVLLLEKEIKELNNRIQMLTEVCDELRENYINLYRRTNQIKSKKNLI